MNFLRNGLNVKLLSYYLIFQILFVVLFIILSSLGAFFHFLLNHEMSVIESWLHLHQWETLIISKGLAFFILHRWFHIRLYQANDILSMIKKTLQTPKDKPIIITSFILLSFLSLVQIEDFSSQFTNGYYYFLSFLGILFLYGIDLLFITYLYQIYPKTIRESLIKMKLSYLLIFLIAFKLCVPDYYHFFPFVIFSYSMVLLLAESLRKIESGAFIFILFFLAPLGPLLGVDPIWGSDYSLMRMKEPPSVTFLVLLWMISFVYYQTREKLRLAFMRLHQKG